MCHGVDSRPPAAPAVSIAAESSRVMLGMPDGSSLSAAIGLPIRHPRAGIVVLPDVRGLHGYYIALVDRLAEAGLAAIAIDYFDRTAGPAEQSGRDGAFEYATHLPSVSPEQVDSDTELAIAEIRRRTRLDLPVFVMGFCFGGSNAWRQAASSLDLAGCIGFYGQPTRVGDAADSAARPTLMLIAGDDTFTEVDTQLALAARMRAAGAEVTDIVFYGAPHSFFDRSSEQWDTACTEAWISILAFVEQHAL